MAEAVVDGTPMSRFFCHKCSVEIERLLPDFKCPRCTTGFIEELESGSNDSGSGMDASSENLSDIDIPDYNFSQHYGPERELVEVIFGLTNSGQAPGTANRNNAPGSRRRVNWPQNSQDTRRSNSSRGGQGMVRLTMENIIHDIIFNLPGAGLDYPVSQDGQPPALFLGNPGDYAWGRDDLDVIVTQLLNQMDETGPPPLPRKQIDKIPTTTITQSQVDSKLQCSVCWEDFKLSEPVRQLSCEHLFHASCIIPWLELHGTCPICRQILGEQNSTERVHHINPTLAAIYRRMTARSYRRTSSSTSSSAGNNSSNNFTTEI